MPFLQSGLIHFQHIPKTGGTSIINWFDQNGWLNRGERAELSSFRLFLSKTPEGLNPMDAEIAKTIPTSVLTVYGWNDWWLNSHIAWWEYEWWKAYVGDDRLFPNNTLDKYEKIAVLRPGLSHALSWYRFLLGARNHYLTPTVKKCGSFEEWLKYSIAANREKLAIEEEEPFIRVIPGWHNQIRYVWNRLWTGESFSTDHQLIHFENLQESWVNVGGHIRRRMVNKVRPGECPELPWLNITKSVCSPHRPEDVLAEDPMVMGMLEELYLEELENVDTFRLV